jgi:hypothetical protein
VPKHHPLLPEYGARLIGKIQKIEADLYRATCRAELDCGSSVLQEAQSFRMASSYEEAKAWIDNVAAMRGFSSWWNNLAH